MAEETIDEKIQKINDTCLKIIQKRLDFETEKSTTSSINEVTEAGNALKALAEGIYQYRQETTRYIAEQKQNL